MSKTLKVFGLLIFSSVGFLLSAQGQGKFPVIVVFEDNVRFEDFERYREPNERSAVDPDAWGYLKKGVVGAVNYLEKKGGFQADHVFSHSVRGFAAKLNTRQIQELENDSMVHSVTEDGIVTINAQVLPWGINRIDADVSSTLAGNGSGSINNVNVYIIDTGIDTNHADLNVVKHVNFAGGQNKDCNGHGTHVAGTAAARDNAIDVVGVAPGAKLIGVKVLGCSGSGSYSNVIKGIDWVTADANSLANANTPAVANMSLGGGVSDAVDNAVKRSADSGVFYSIAAGNSGALACNSSPARAGTHNGVMTTAAIDINSQEASFSNYGSCVDIWAPGVDIVSTRNGGGITPGWNGTSMAAPHVAGTGALYLSTHTSASAAGVEGALKSGAIATGTNSKDGVPIKRVNAGSY